eukprot:175205-Rhodomonas_salina.1
MRKEREEGERAMHSEGGKAKLREVGYLGRVPVAQRLAPTGHAHLPAELRLALHAEGDRRGRVPARCVVVEDLEAVGVGWR